MTRQTASRARLARAGAATLAASIMLSAMVSAWAEPGTEDKKRRAPPEPPSLVVGALRYEAPLLGQPYGYQQDGGIIVARQATTGSLEWTRRIYTADRDPTMESDKQDVFIEQLTLSPDKKRLVIVNERGQRFELNLDGSRLRARR